MKILEIFTKKDKKSDFSDFFAKPIGTQKRVIKAVIREANKEQKDLYDKYRQTSSTKLKTL